MLDGNLCAEDLKRALSTAERGDTGGERELLDRRLTDVR